MLMSDTILHTVYRTEAEMNTKEYLNPLKRVIGVRIHPRVFHELASEKEARQRLELHSNAYHTLMGIPLEITRAVEEWEIVV